jgi:hypothetical protein
MTPAYFADLRVSGPILFGVASSMVRVLERQNDLWPIGIASEIGSSAHGLAVWSLYVRSEYIPGNWIIVDGQFVAYEDEPG